MADNVWSFSAERHPIASPDCAAAGFVAWLKTALATPHPIIVDGTACPSVPRRFWVTVCGALTWSERVDWLSRLTLVHVSPATRRALRTALLHTPTAPAAPRHVS